MHSTVWAPSVGGVEAVGEMLAREWLSMGIDVRVSTDTSGRTDGYPFQLIRNPNSFDLSRMTRWADVVFHNHPSIRRAWAPLLHGKPWCATVHTWLPYCKNQSGFDLRRSLLGRCHLAAVSHAILAHLPDAAAPIIPNPYNANLFRPGLNRSRTNRLLFVGRLVSDKGLHVLLEALGILRDRGIHAALDIVGEGPEKARLLGLAAQIRVMDRVCFLGRQPAERVAEMMSDHRFTVIPSVWEEPFGLVALEALACGSIPVVSDIGGLPEAAGSFGVIFPAGDAAALAECIASRADANAPDYRNQDALAEHLQRHGPANVAQIYLDRLLQPACVGQ